MLPNVFKTSKTIDFDKLMKTYIIKNYGKINNFDKNIRQCFLYTGSAGFCR